MKHCITLLIISLACCTFSTAQDAEPSPAPIIALQQKFSNLPEKTRKDYSAKLIKIQSLFNQKRVFDVFEKSDELEKIFPNHPAALTVKGACYVELRSFDKASALFNEVLRIDPNNVNVKFNIAEVQFVTKKWDSAYEQFKALIPILAENKNNKEMVRLCELKLLLCELKTDRVKEAIALKDKYDIWDDSPFYYYSRAALLYHQDDESGAIKMLRNARAVWRDQNRLAPWQDTLIEYGFINSFYGENEETE